VSTDLPRAFNRARIDALAQALRMSPRQLLVAAARLAREDAAAAPERRRAALADARAALAPAEGVAALLSTPIASFAQDDVDRALASLWAAP